MAIYRDKHGRFTAAPTQPEGTEALRPATPTPDPVTQPSPGEPTMDLSEPWPEIDTWTPASVGLAVALLLVAVVVVAVFALAVA